VRHGTQYLLLLPPMALLLALLLAMALAPGGAPQPRKTPAEIAPHPPMQWVRLCRLSARIFQRHLTVCDGRVAHSTAGASSPTRTW
jgi:hypothetical protein